MRLDIEVARQVECADVDPERAAENLRRMVPQSMSSFAAPSTAPDRRHPTTHIISNLWARPPFDVG
jgi:hypothetical protein